MGLNRYAKRRDANEPEIIKALEKIGCSILQVDPVDLIVGYRGKNFLLEVKTVKGKLEPSQVVLLETWRGQYRIVRTPEEAIKLVTENNS